MVERVDRLAQLDPVYYLLQNPLTKPQPPSPLRQNNENIENFQIKTNPLTPLSPSHLLSPENQLKNLQKTADKETEIDEEKNKNKIESEIATEIGLKEIILEKETEKDTVKEVEIFDLATDEIDSAFLPSFSSFLTELEAESKNDDEKYENEEKTNKLVKNGELENDFEIRGEISKYFTKKYELDEEISPNNIFITSLGTNNRKTISPLALSLSFLLFFILKII